MIIVQISNHLSARNFSPNFGAICTARYPMKSEWSVEKKTPGVENVEIVPHRRGICAKGIQTRGTVRFRFLEDHRLRENDVEGR